MTWPLVDSRWSLVVRRGSLVVSRWSLVALIATSVTARAATVIAQESRDSQESKTDVTGKWTFTVQTDAGSGTPTVTLKQDGEKLTGHYSSANLGEAELTGTIKGKDIKFSFSADAGGQAVQVTYTGTVDTKDSMKGSVDLGGLAQGTFTAKRQ
jgi:hypothetical protein